MPPNSVTSSAGFAFLLIALIALIEAPAEAYVDPGSASYVFQLIVGGLLAGGFLVRTYWSRVVTLLRNKVFRAGASTK
jgi:hypothetical protein